MASFLGAVAGCLDTLAGGIGVVGAPIHLGRTDRVLPGAMLGMPTTGVLASVDNAALILALIASTAVLTLAAWGVFRFFDHRARELGLLDQTTGS